VCVLYLHRVCFFVLYLEFGSEEKKEEKREMNSLPSALDIALAEHDHLVYMKSNAIKMNTELKKAVMTTEQARIVFEESEEFNAMASSIIKNTPCKTSTSTGDCLVYTKPMTHSSRVKTQSFLSKEEQQILDALLGLPNIHDLPSLPNGAERAVKLQ